MEHSMTLLTAQIHFLDTELALIHIPLELYTFYLQPILQLLLPSETHQAPGDDLSPSTENARSRRPWVYEHPFVNISVTPVECSIACSRGVANELFDPLRQSLNIEYKGKVSISHENYVVIQVDGQGLDAGQRVLELTSPLAMNGISIFFITTYFSDYILVPLRSRSTVIQALEDRGFVFESNAEAFVNVSSPLLHPSLTRRNSSSTNSIDFFDTSRPPSTPPPSSIAELQTRTFSTLNRHNIHPQVDPSIQLLQCAGRKDTLRGGMGKHSSSLSNMSQMQLGLIKCLITAPYPKFFSLTLTDTEPASLLLEKGLLAHFGRGDDGDDILLGSKDDILIPIMLDLRELPLESTGIVCGIAGRLIGGTSVGSVENTESSFGIEGSQDMELDAVEMYYLSTARAGNVMVAEEELIRAMAALNNEGDNGKNGEHGNMVVS